MGGLSATGMMTAVALTSLLPLLQVFVKTESQREGYIQLALQAYEEAMATSSAS